MHKRNSKLVLQFTLVLCALSFVPFLYFYNQLSLLETKTEQHVEQLNRNKLEYAKAELNSTMVKISSSIRYLAHNNMLLQAIKNPTPSNIDALEDFWLLIARTQGYYSQLRILSSEGMELIRVNSGEHYIEVVDKSDLQFKGDRDYFKYAKTLKPQQMGTFGIDLEVENGVIVQPLTPAYRIIFPISYNSQTIGYFVANLDLLRLYKNLAYKGLIDNLPNIATDQGYYLMSSQGSNIMGHLLNDNSEHNLAIQHPNLWRNVQLRESGTAKGDHGWFSFTKSSIGDSARENNLVIFLTTDFSEAQTFSDHERQEIYQQAALITIITLLLTFSFVTWNFNHRKNSLDSKIARAAMNGMSAMVITDRNNKIVQVNEEFTRASGYKLEDVKGKPPSLFSSGKHSQDFYIKMWRALKEYGLWEGEVVNKRQDGSQITEILRIQTVKDKNDTIQFYVASFIDISQRKELENRLRELSLKDPLTSLWNRRKFDSEIQSHAARYRRYQYSEGSTLALIDIDHFKRINDQYGHDQGDVVIKEVADSLKEQLRETDIIARIGGEEFALIMPHTELKEAEVVLNRIRIAVNLNSQKNVTVSVGITEISDAPEETYKRADIALYESKSLGRNQVSVLSVVESHSFA